LFPQIRSLRFGIVTLAVALSLALIAIEGIGLYRDLRAAAALAEERTQNTSKLLEAYTRQTFRRLDGMLRRVVQLAAVSDPASNTDPVDLRSRLASFVPGDGLIFGFSVLDASGRLLATTLPAAWSLESLQGGPADPLTTSDALRVGAPLRVGTDRRRLLPVYRTVPGSGGASSRTLVALVDVAYFQPMVDAVDSGKDGGVSLFLNNGWILARAPQDDAILDRRWNDAPMFREHLPRAAINTVRQVTVADGIERIFTYRALADYPVVVYVGRSVADTRSAVWMRTARVATVLALELAGVWLFTWLLLRADRQQLASDRALKESEQQFALAFEFASIGKLLALPDGRTQRVNRVLCRMLDTPESELLERPLEEFFVVDDRAMVLAVTARAMADAGRSQDGEVRALRADGQPVWVRLSVSLVRDEQQRPLRLVCQFQDISEAKAASQALIQLNAELEERVRERTRELEEANLGLKAFSHSIAHDLRSPMTAIDGFSYMLGEQLTDATDRHYAERIRTGIRQMQELMDALLSMAQLSREPLRRQPVDLTAMAHSVVEALQKAEPGRRAELRVDDGMVVAGDPLLLRVVMENLLGNAWKFSAGREVTRIAVGQHPDEDGQRVCFVRDNGAGFDMKFASKLFVPFGRLHSVAEFPGTGIGLANVQRIVVRHGGRVWVEAKPAEGATFFFCLPAAPVSAPVPLAAS
jgi:PAS domain S-box-containing protein